MALIIERVLDTRFELTYNSEPTISSDQNRLFTYGNLCHFKTGTGANIIKEQNVSFADVTVIDTFGATGSHTFANITELWNKLIELKFFDGLATGSGGGSTTFLGLTDTDPYFGNDGKVPIVNLAENKLDYTTFYNFDKFTQLSDVEVATLIDGKIVGVTLIGGIPKLTLIDKPTDGTTYFSAVGGFDYNDLDTQTTPLAYTTGDLQLTNDALGSNTFLSQPPYGITRLWDEATNTLDFSQLSIGDKVDLNILLFVTTSGANQNTDIKLLLGEGTANEETYFIETFFTKTAGITEMDGEISFMIKNNDHKDTPAKILFSSDASASIEVNTWKIYVIRKSVNLLDVDVSGYSEKQPYQLATSGQTVISVDPTYVSIDLYINRTQQREGSDPSDDYSYTAGTATMKYPLSEGDTIDVRGYKESTDPIQAIPPIVNTYDNLAALIVAQASQLPNYVYEVTDGSGFSGITGKLWVRYLGTTEGNTDDYSWEPRTSGTGAVDSVNGQTGVVVLDADDIDDSATTNKFVTASEITKLGHISVTQAVDLDQMETDIAALANGMVYKGDWDASVGTFPGASVAQIGWFYYVSVAGTVDGIDFAIGDNIVATVDNASTTTYASNWSKHDQTDAVQAVAGLTGSISASGLRAAINVEDGADVTDAANVNAAGAVMESDSTTASMAFVIDEDNMVSNSATKVPTQQSVKAYADSVGKVEYLMFAVGDETTLLTTGTAKITFRMPYAMTLTSVRANVNTAPTGATIIVDINETGATILSTKLSIDATEKTSTTALAPPVISDTALADDAEITIDIDQVGSTIAGKGLKVTLIGTRT